MDTLETYLNSDYLAEQQELAAVNQILGTLAVTFSETCNGNTWSYEFKVRVDHSCTKVKLLPAEVKLSQGTQAMVLIASGRMLGNCALPKGGFSGLEIEGLNGLRDKWKLALGILIDDLANKKGVLSSFGENNPITLSHITELRALLNTNASDFLDQKYKLTEGIRPAVEKLEELLATDLSTAILLEPSSDVGRYHPNAFVPLRVLRAASDLMPDSSIKLARHRSLFESALHDQLSFSSIPDSRFDPAELAFCLEGLLLCAPEAVDSSLFDRVLEVLAEKQNTSAHWRPNKPFIANSRGQIMLPVSVEGANSLLRSIAMMDKGRFYDTFTAKSLPLLKRFWHWLRARSIRFDHNGQQCIGWHSEHVNDPTVIHIWDTSQVAEFMIYFKEMLERHIATTTLRLSRLNIKRFNSSKISEGDTKVNQWQEKISNFEPMLEDGIANKIYEQLKVDFVIPWASGIPVNYSMLLYGPPGTGKSTVAENLAKVLNMSLITVTVSDFLGSGGANVEARAKAIFQTLEAQEGCVILFDEIDNFLLNRDSERYEKQDSLFQFLTPGMLTKINDLRKQQRAIFIIATNYANRIDPAIKRTGRIDKQYLLPLPNAARRLRILLEGVSGNNACDTDSEGLFKQNTVFYSYSDLKGAVKDAGGKSATIDTIKKSLNKLPPSNLLASYFSRLNSPEDFPKDELIGLITLAKEANKQTELDKLLESNELKLKCLGIWQSINSDNRQVSHVNA